MTTSLSVSAWGSPVGMLTRDPRSGECSFEYDDRWLARGIELAPVTMPARPGRFAFPDLPVDTYHRLPPVISDCLPDDFGNAVIDARALVDGVPAGAMGPLERLALLGPGGMGALEFSSLDTSVEAPESLDIAVLVAGARAVLGGGEWDETARTAVAVLSRSGIQAGGARAKAIIGWSRGDGRMTFGADRLAPGFEHWLVKLDGVGLDSELGTGGAYGRVEYAYHLMARAAGIEMAECAILEENGRAHFVTRRFDRDPAEGKLHAVTLCATSLLDFRARGTNDYAGYFQTITSLGLGPAAVEQAFRRMVLNVLARNCDDHTKNFSFLLDSAGHWSLAPAYDVTYAYNPNGAWTYQHLMSVNGRFDRITRADFLAVADRFGIGEPDILIGEVQQAVASWPQFAQQAGVREEQWEDIRSTYPQLEES